MLYNSKVSRLEIDVFQSNELRDASELSVKYKLPAIIVHPQLIQEALLTRARCQGTFKIIAPVDSPKGEKYNLLKLRDLPIDAMSIDGYEFIITPNKSTAETALELRNLNKFVKDYLGTTIEIRFVILSSSISDINFNNIVDALVGLQTPNYIRTDFGIKQQNSKVSLELHNAYAARIKSKVGFPIKISGNLTSFDQIDTCPGATRFAVGLQQAKVITKESSL